MKKVDKIIHIVLLLCCFTVSPVWAQVENPKAVRGVVRDLSSGEPMPFATVRVEQSDKGAVTDSLGQFVLNGIPIGRHVVLASFVGYEPNRVYDVLVTSSKEVYLEIMLKEDVRELSEVVVRPSVNKEQALNKMATTGARMLSVEEAKRYAGGFDDPARLASSFSGVSSDGATNGISIHGNAPHLLSWKMEDVEIPNPNHFADISVLGGGIFSSLSSLVLGNSDFFTGAFPSEYSNAVSGVFDMKMRNGNDRRHEHTIQVGVGGIDVASEGPLCSKNNSSYIVNYRYSMTGLITQMGLMDMGGQEMEYQDLNFKLNLPTRRAGVFTAWGTGLIDNFSTEQKDSTEWEFTSDKSTSASTQYMMAGGLGHTYFLGGGAQIKTSVATTFFKEHAYSDSYEGVLLMDMNRKFTNLIINSAYNRKFSTRLTSKTGFTYTQMFYDMNMEKAPYLESSMQGVYDGKGNTGLLSVYTSNAWRMNETVTLNVGVNGQWLTLNNAWTVEPRLGIKWQPLPKHSFACAYGMHSRMEKMDVYFVEVDNKLVNQELGFTKSHHFMLTYEWKASERINLKIEPFYQALYDVPVEENSSYSVLNRSDFYLDKALVNEGKGENYGVDLTIERYMERGWYAMVTGSLFSSRYRGGDGVWHNSRYNRRFIVNALGGKEWLLGSRKQNILSVNLKGTIQGGDRYSPIDMAATMAHPDQQVQYDETRAYSLQRAPILVFHYTVSYKLNKKNVSHEFSIKHINATGTKTYYGDDYNYRTNKIEPSCFALSLPNVSYKLEF